MSNNGFIDYLLLAIGILMFFLGVWLIIRRIVYIALFPGASWLWRRKLEVNYCKEISAQLADRFKSLGEFLQIAALRQTSLPEPYLQNPKHLLDSLLENYSLFDKKLSRRQQNFVNLLQSLKENLVKTKVTINDSEEFTMYEWLEIRLEASFVEKIEINDYTSTSPIIISIDYCMRIVKLLEVSSSSKNFLGYIRRWVFNDVIGTIEYMRADLKQRFHSKELTIKNGKVEINCMIIEPEEPSGLTVIFCNPNAGYYEFTYFQSEWLEFYLPKGISMLLWNYRGYGKSTGTPSIDALVQDGKLIVKYLKSTSNIRKIALHGESMGGCIAIHIAKELDCDILLADRTFSSLNEAILFSLGRFAQFCFKLSGFSDISSVPAYLSLTCFKILSCDPSDSVILNLASLKCGVALALTTNSNLPLSKYFSHEKFASKNQILTNSQCSNFCKALRKIVFVKKTLNSEPVQEKLAQAVLTEFTEESDFKSLVNKIMQAIDDVNAGGMKISEVIIGEHVELQMQSWLMVLQVWGEVGNTNQGFPFEGVLKAIAELRIGIVQLKEFEGCEIWKEFEVIAKGFKQILDVLQEKCRRQSLGESVDENENGFMAPKSGYLIPLKCGHSGQFSSHDNYCYDQYLTDTKFY